jgi:threonine/homoserine/homoserine lactone efflux protein
VIIPRAPILQLLALSLAVNLSPGPGMLYVLSRSLVAGFRAALTAQLGLATGILIHVSVIAFGLAHLFVSSPSSFAAIRWAGAVYLAWLGIRLIARAGSAPPRLANTTSRDDYLRGVGISLLNPYIVLFLLAILPQFAHTRDGVSAGKLIALGCCFAVTGSAVNLSVGFLATRSTAAFGATRELKFFQRGLGTLIVLFALRLAFR